MLLIGGKGQNYEVKAVAAWGILDAKAAILGL